MKTFISATDIEALAAQGVRELTVDEDTILTAVAREAAAQLGVKLVAPGAAAVVANLPVGADVPVGADLRVRPSAVFGKPKGCQHGPLDEARGSQPVSSAKAASPVVDQLIGAVKQLYGRS